MSDLPNRFESINPVTGTTYAFRRNNPQGGPARRWAIPYHTGLAVTSQTFTAGRVLLLEFELQDPTLIDAITYIVGGTSNGNVRAGVYGPLTTEETLPGVPLLVESASVAQGTANTDQTVPLTATYAQAGRYYAALQGSSATGTYMRQSNQIQVTGWSAIYDRAGGYGAFTTPIPAVTSDGSAMPGLRVRLAAS